jgi:hypothetical protein
MEKKVLITLAESAGEALSDFVGFVSYSHDMDIDESSIRELSNAEIGSEVFNIVEFDSELPEDFDGWFVVDVISGTDEWLVEA